MKTTETKERKVTINQEQRLYVIPCGDDGYTCLGFDVCKDWTERIQKEINQKSGGTLFANTSEKVGTIEAYEAYRRVCGVAAGMHAIGHRFTCMLTPELIGKEGKRVEVVDCYGEKRQFIVGKSCGWLPIHLEIKTRSSIGGEAVMGTPFKSVRVLK